MSQEDSALPLADGIILMGRYGPFSCGAWILHHNGECALLETPQRRENESPAGDIKKFVEERGWRVKYVLLSHHHIDHMGSIDQYKDLFPEARFLTHRAIAELAENLRLHMSLFRRRPFPTVNPEKWKNGLFTDVFDEEVRETDIGGEPISIVYAPKHSLGDTLIHFRGVVFTGDWWLFEGDPQWCGLAGALAAHSVTRVMKYVHDKNIRVHAIFSTHADQLMQAVNFKDVMKRTLDYHLALPKRDERLPDCSSCPSCSLSRVFWRTRAALAGS
ncbi:MAG: MBL fold metallo-hydrolase [Armatimonadetes bacterium]|nr:MBL fold metallo-hydrolase [Armatimonadota bacterium]